MTVLAQVPSNLSPCILMEKILHNNHGANLLELAGNVLVITYTAPKKKFSIKDFFSKCD